MWIYISLNINTHIHIYIYINMLYLHECIYRGIYSVVHDSLLSVDQR
jgi:hypothetical protein